MMRLAERQLRKEVTDTCNEAYRIGGNEWRSVILDQANECWLKEEIERVLLQARKNGGSVPALQTAIGPPDNRMSVSRGSDKVSGD